MFVIPLNDTALKTLLFKILITKIILQATYVGKIFFVLTLGKIWAYMGRFYCPNSDFKGKHAFSDPNHTSKRQVLAIV